MTGYTEVETQDVFGNVFSYRTFLNDLVDVVQNLCAEVNLQVTNFNVYHGCLKFEEMFFPRIFQVLPDQKGEISPTFLSQEIVPTFLSHKF